MNAFDKLSESTDGLALKMAQRLADQRDTLALLESQRSSMYGQTEMVDISIEECRRQIRSIENTLLREGYSPDGTRSAP